MPWRRSAGGAQDPIGRVAGDPAAVFDTDLDGVAEVEPDEDA